MGVGAEGAAAVGDHILIGRKLGEPFVQLVERDRSGAIDVTRVELLRRANVDQDHLTGAQPPAQLLAPDALNLLTEIGTRGALDLTELGGGGVAKGEPDGEGLIASEGVTDPRPLALSSDQAGCVENLEVLRGVGARLATRLSELVDRSRGLGQQLELLKSARAGERLAHDGDRLEQGLLPRAANFIHGLNIQAIN